MNLHEMKQGYGDEYPAAVVVNGVRLPLRREGRFVRHYHSDEHKLGSQISRFMDETASIAAAELQQEWPSWSARDRMDFCQECSWLHEQPDFPEMLRFIMQHGGPDDWSALALSVAGELPTNEAFEILLRALRSVDIGKTSNFTQAIAGTKHPDAEPTLRNHLLAIWKYPTLWADDDFQNWAAFDATTCIAHLIELGAAPADFTEQVRRLSEHPCSGNRDSCRGFLAKHYPWLK